MKKIILLGLILVTSCSQGPLDESQVKKRVRNLLVENVEDFKGCAIEYSDKTKTENSRIKIIIYLTLNSKGEVVKFWTNDKNNKKSELTNCMINVLENIKFPELGGSLWQIEQPFVFKN
ncbi:MAG: hypothetical protein JNM93_07220 [Bacteriovoracaceae bacterium]|nr:hypothetical protein [Bacteriovoracaceae bacterium]